MAFIEKFQWMVGVLVDYEACKQIAYENVLDAQAEGLDYVELRFSPWFMAEPHGLDPQGIVEAVGEGVDEARSETGMLVNLIGILSRTYGAEVCEVELDALLAHKDKFVAIDLAGDEANYPGNLFIEHIRKARLAGWRVTIHAGESAGPESIWQAINDLGAERIGHAVHAADDQELMQNLLEKNIGIETNITSNVQTSTVADFASHPIKRFLEFGLLATINTDDPGISGIDLKHEYEVAAPAAGLSQAQIHQAQKNALQIAFLSEDEKARLANKKRGETQN
jgi:adenosine deaminase